MLSSINYLVFDHHHTQAHYWFNAIQSYLLSHLIWHQQYLAVQDIIHMKIQMQKKNSFVESLHSMLQFENERQYSELKMVLSTFNTIQTQNDSRIISQDLGHQYLGI